MSDWGYYNDDDYDFEELNNEENTTVDTRWDEDEEDEEEEEDQMKLTDAVVGRKVTYGSRFSEIEEGVITSVTDRFVFVRYGNDVNAKSTNPADIEYLQVDVKV